MEDKIKDRWINIEEATDYSVTIREWIRNGKDILTIRLVNSGSLNALNLMYGLRVVRVPINNVKEIYKEMKN